MASGRLLLLLRLSCGILCAVLIGIDISFNVYAVTLKDTFNLTQTQVEIIASMGSLGNGLTFLETLITGIFGYTATFVVSWSLLTSSTGLYSLAAVYKGVVHDWPVWVYFTQLGLCTGTGMACMVVTRACLLIISKRHTGTFLGIFGAATCFGKIAFAGLFHLILSQDLVQFFICLCVLFAILFGVCYCLLHPVISAPNPGHQTDNDPYQTDNDPYQADNDPYQTDNDPKGNSESGWTNDSTVKDLLRSSFFHMMFWATTVVSATGYSILNNITSITDSIGVPNAFDIVTTMSVSIMVAGALYGQIYDKFSSSKTCGFTLLFSMYFSLAAGLVVGMYFLNTRTVYVMGVLYGLAIGPSFTLPLSIMVVQFGRSSYSFVASSLNVTAAVAQVLIQILVGLLYNVQSNGFPGTISGHTCYGLHCFFYSFVALFSLVTLATIVQIVNFIRHFKTARANVE